VALLDRGARDAVIFGVVCGLGGDTMPIVRPANAHEAWELNDGDYENANLHGDDNLPENNGHEFANCLGHENSTAAALAGAARRSSSPVQLHDEQRLDHHHQVHRAWR
jgi:hypothetical protein